MKEEIKNEFFLILSEFDQINPAKIIYEFPKSISSLSPMYFYILILF